MDYKTKINSAQQVATKAQWEKLLQNGRNRDQDHAPVVKYFDPYGPSTWLISEVDPENKDIAFGLCDLGMDSPELGSVLLSEMCRLQTLERDIHFVTQLPMSQWATASQESGQISA
jgi:hypothetical protein